MKCFCDITVTYNCKPNLLFVLCCKQLQAKEQYGNSGCIADVLDVEIIPVWQ